MHARALFLGAALVSSALLIVPVEGHPVHFGCSPNYDHKFDLWINEYLGQLLSNNPDDPIEGDILSGILWWNECYTSPPDPPQENWTPPPPPHDICNPLDLRTSGQMIQDWADAHPGQTVRWAVPDLGNEVSACWR